MALAHIRKSRLPGVGWCAFCLRCLWFRSYPSQPVAFHAAGQHIKAKITKETRHGA